MPFRGLIGEIPIGWDGLTGNKNLSQVRPAQLLEALNLSFESGTNRKEGGSSKYNSTAISGTPKILAGHDWYPSSGVQRAIVYTNAGDLLRDTGDGSFGTTLKSGLTTSAVPVFVEGGKEVAANNKKLFIFNGNDAVQVLSGDGTTTSDLTTPPLDWSGANQPLFGVAHERRIWGGGNLNDPHRIYATNPDDHEDYTGTGRWSSSIFAGEGDRLIGGISFKGLLILFKSPRGVYVVDTSSFYTSNWRAIRLNIGVGMKSPLAVVQVDDDIIFLDNVGNFQALSAVTEFGDVRSKNLGQIAEMADFIRTNINLSRLDQVRGIYYPEKREAHFAMASTGSTANDRRIVIDMNRLDLPRFRFSDKDVCESLWLRQDTNGIPRPTSGDEAGFVWKLDQEARSKDGAGYMAKFQTPHTDLGYVDPRSPALATRIKHGKFLVLVVEPKGNWNLSVEIIWDGTVKETVLFNMGQTGVGLGSFVLGTDVLSGDQVLNKKKRIGGSGIRFSMRGSNSGDSQDFSVARAFLYFVLGRT